ncbi:MAG: hypothetical protein WAV09_03505 [Minisyncoccia bacterium]
MSAENVDEVLIRLAQYASLPSVWIFKDTELCIGDLRLLAEEVQSLRAQLSMKKRDDLLHVATAIIAQRPMITPAFAVAEASNTIAAVDEAMNK